MTKVFIKTTPQHEAFYNAVLLAMKDHAGDMSSVEILCILSQIVGKVAALMDQRVVTPEMARDLIANNIQLGNDQVVQDMMKTEGNA